MSKPTLSRKARTRILKLADYMSRRSRSLAPHFDMEHFFDHQSGADAFAQEIEKGAGDRITEKDMHNCGTSACAFGYAPFAGVDPKLESRLTPDGFGGLQQAFYYNNRKIRGTSFRAALRIFDVNHKQGTYLFSAHEFITTPAQWAKRARRFVELRGDVNDVRMPR